MKTLLVTPSQKIISAVSANHPYPASGAPYEVNKMPCIEKILVFSSVGGIISYQRLSRLSDFRKILGGAFYRKLSK
jgi:hypothetical protein